MISRTKQDKSIMVICLLLSLLILLFDLTVELGVAAAVPYVLVILIATQATNPRVAIDFALICTLFTLVGLAFSEQAGVYWVVLANRGLALLVIWTSLYLAFKKKKAEQETENVRTKYFHHEKFVALGSMAAGIMHEVGNPITSMSGLVDELKYLHNNDNQLSKNKHQTSLQDNQTLEHQRHQQTNEYLDLLSAELQRIVRLIRDVDNLAKMPVDVTTLVDLNELIGRTCRLLSHDEKLWPIDIQFIPATQLPAISLNADYFIQVLQNIIINAADACIASPTALQRITISSSTTDNLCIIQVKDYGIGMSSKTLELAQTEFYTTKGNKGSGLGLFICQKLVSENNGFITIDSVENKGTIVSINYPLQSV